MGLFSRNTPQVPGGPSPLRRRIGADVARTLEANPAVQSAGCSVAQIYYAVDFLTPAECDTLIGIIDAGVYPSGLLNNRNGADFRTSFSCDLDRWSPEVHPVDERIAHLLGVDPDTGETLQGQRYQPGQHFRAHHDYFDQNEPYWPKMRDSGGQRVWTAMAYLNDVEEGGATWFPQAGIRVAPRRGLLLMWNNMATDGSPNRFTVHEGMTVTKGTKYIVTKWFREGNWVR